MTAAADAPLLLRSVSAGCASADERSRYVAMNCLLCARTCDRNTIPTAQRDPVVGGGTVG